MSHNSANKGATAVIVISIIAASVIIGAFLLFSIVDAGNEVVGTTSTASHKEFTLVAQDASLEMTPGEIVKTWTFNGTVPGPTIRFTEGDNVTIHFINKTPLAHTVHFHGNHDEKNDGVLPQVLPGQNYTYNFIADPAGAFMYHCHAYPTSLHIRMGMYGAIIVDPKDSSTLKPAREFSLVLSEYDPVNQDNFVAKYYPVNGYVDQYMGDNALQVNQGELVRLYIVNIGTTIPYSFHLHSTIFKVYQSGLPSNSPFDAQTIEIGPGNTAIVEARWNSPGTYLFHSHGMQEERGNMGQIHVLPNSDASSIADPSSKQSMIEWQYQLQKKLQKPTVLDYGDLTGSSAPAEPLHNHSGQDSASTTVKIVKGAWDKNQKNNYQPTETSIRLGSTIGWTNEDSVVHSVTSKQEGLFDSTLITPGQEWQHQFNEVGQYEYYCIVHPWMEGKVIVSQ